MYNKKIVAIDSQKLDSIMSCMYQFKLKYIENFSSGETPDYYERGGLMHSMLDPYYKMKKHKSRWRQNNKSHQDVVNSCIIIGRNFARKLNIDIAEIEMCIDTFQKYTDFWENDGFNDILAVENVGSKILYDSPELLILYEYKCDLVLRINNNIVVVDHKTAKARRDPNYLSNQFRGYCWALDINTMLVNEIGFQKTLPPKDKFRRSTLTYSPNMIEEWKKDAIWWIKQAVSNTDADIFPRNVTSCDKFPNCPFRQQICSSDPEVRDFKKEQYLKQKSWDVGKDNL